MSRIKISVAPFRDESIQTSTKLSLDVLKERQLRRHFESRSEVRPYTYVMVSVACFPVYCRLNNCLFLQFFLLKSRIACSRRRSNQKWSWIILSSWVSIWHKPIAIDQICRKKTILYRIDKCVHVCSALFGVFRVLEKSVEPSTTA